MDTTTNSQMAGPGLPEDISTAYRESTEYHWRRIITAILITLASLTLMGWLLMNLISVEDAAKVASAVQVEPELPLSKVGTAAASEAEPEIQKLEQAIPPVETTVNDTLTITETNAPDTPAPELLTEILPLTSAISEAPAEKKPTEELADNSSAIAAPALSTPTLSPPTVSGYGLPVDLAPVTRNPEFVGALQLTSDLENKDPTDRLGAEIVLGDRDIIRVYAYSELNNLKGEHVFHVWYRDDERVARIPVGVYLDSMRASSSKYINRNMVGDWRMEIVRPNGERLGRVDFRVIDERS